MSGTAEPQDTVRLSNLEQFVVRRAKTNKLGFIVAATLPICLVSVGLTASFLFSFGAFDDPTVQPISMIAGFLIPATVAPPILAYLIAIVCRVDEAAEKLQRSAHTDPLTSTLNRRGFFSRLAPPPTAIDDAQLIVIDLDDFKNLNDTHGHDLGDQALVAVADWLQTVAGPDGVVGRFGGDEFVCVTTVDRSQDLDRTHHFELEHNGSSVPFSVSIGAVPLRDTTAIDDALRSADAALYEQKANRKQSARRHANA